MGDVANLDEFRLKKRAERDADMNVAVCMSCGDEFPWGRRLDHRCMESSRHAHPSMQ